MKIFFDLLPVILFFIAYKMRDIYVATAVLMVFVTLQIAILWLWKRKVEKMYMITFVAVLLFGGATLILRNPDFIKWKPSIVNWIFGAIFLGSQFMGKQPLVEKMMTSVIELSPIAWIRLNLVWVAFFVFCGVANIAVAYTCTENAWVNFKLFGLTALSFVFMLGQVFLLRGYLREPVRETEENQEIE